MSTINKLKNAWLSTATDLSGNYQTCSLLNNGKSEFANDVIIDSKLSISKAIDAANNYKLDVSGNTCLTDLIIKNKNTLSNIQIISSSTTLSFGSAEYVCISSTFPNNGQITLPLVNNANQLGTKFTFFYGSSSTIPNVSIYANTSQTISDNTTGIDNTFVNIDSNKPFIELVSIATSGVCWAQSNGLFSYTEFGGIIQDNSWTGINTFNSFLPTSTLTPSSNTQLVTKIYADGLITTLKASANAWTSTNTFNTSLPTSTLTPSSNTQLVTKIYADGLITTLKSSANAWTSTNTFNTSLPTSTLTPSSNTQLVTKVYADGLITTLKSSANAWTNTNTFNTSLPTSTLTPTLNTQLITKAYADGTFQPISSMSNYVLQSYLIANYHTTTYIEINFASLFTNNTFLGDCSFSGITNFQNNVSITNSKTLTVQSSSNLTMDTGSNLYVNGGMTVTGLATFQSPNEPTLNGVRIANLDDIKYPQTPLYAPSFRSTSQSLGGVICAFSSENGDSRLWILDEGHGKAVENSSLVFTQAGNGLGFMSENITSSLYHYIGSTLIHKISSTGVTITGNLSVTGNISYSGTIAGISSTVLGYLSGVSSNIQTQISNLISGNTSHTNITFTGNLNSMTTTIFSAINTAFGKQTASLAGSVITAAITLSAPFANVYSINNGVTPFTITLPQASASNSGVILTFRRVASSTTTTIISLTTSGSTQTLYNSTNTGGTTLTLLASGAYIARITSITNNTAYGWYLL